MPISFIRFCWLTGVLLLVGAQDAIAAESIHFGFNAGYPDQTDAIRLSTRIGPAYWSQNRQNLNPENGLPIPYAYHDGYIERLGEPGELLTAAAMAQRWREIKTGLGDSYTNVSGASIGVPDIIILDELNSNFKDANNGIPTLTTRGPIFREALRLYTLPVGQGGQGGSRDDIVAYVQTGLSQGTGVANGLYDDVIYASNNYMRALALEVYTTEDGFRTGIESSTNPTVYPTGQSYLGVRLTGPLRNWMNRGLNASRVHPILGVSNIADADVNGDYNAFLNEQFWFMANGRYSSNESQIDSRIVTAFQRGVGTYTWAPDIDDDNDPYQLLTRRTLRDNWFESLFTWYIVHNQTSLYVPPAGDYNYDGEVNDGDYLAWNRAFGSTGTKLASDGDGNGIIDSGDYLVWRKNFGVSAFPTGAGSAGQGVPEPSALSILVALTFFTLCRRSPARA